MWLMISVGYLIFIWGWYYLGYVAGDYKYDFSGKFSGWSHAFFARNPGSIVQNATHWSITFIRGIGSVIAGWCLVKFGHKRAVCIALFLMVLSFPFIIAASPFRWNHLTLATVKNASFLNVTNMYGELIATKKTIIGYSLFVIFRVCLAIGGTVLITYTQPIIAQLKDPIKTRLNRSNTLAFSFGVIVAVCFFVFSRDFNKILISNWSVLSIVLIFLCILLLIFYLIFAQNVLSAHDFSEHHVFCNDQMWKLLSNKNVWKFGLLFSIFLILVLLPMTGVMKNLMYSSPANLEFLRKSRVESLSESSLFWVWPLWQIFFVAGIFVGYFVVSSFTKTKYNRKTFIAFCVTLGFVLLFVSLITGYYLTQNTFLLIVHLVTIFLAGIFLWGVESVILAMPHELPKISPRHLSVFYGLMWGIGYFVYTVGDVAFSLIVDTTNFSIKTPVCQTTCTIMPNIIPLMFLVSVIPIAWVIISVLPKTYHLVGDSWVLNDKKWHIWNWKFNKSENLT